MPDPAYFQGLARYNQWANDRLYAGAARLSEEQRRHDSGLFFKSLHGTLAHLLTSDNAWMALLQNHVVQPLEQGAIATFPALRSTRARLDDMLCSMMERLSPEELDAIVAYTPWAGDFAGRPYRQPRRNVLAHLFNHQTHHRGQAHTGFSLLGGEPPPLDLFIMQITGAEARTD